MNRGTIILLCNVTMHAAQPWVDSGYEAVMVDPLHPAGMHRDGLVVRIGATVHGAMEMLRPWLRSGNVVGTIGFPVCTDMASSGTPQWARKFKRDKYFQHKAVLLPEQCRMVGMAAGGWWVMENPNGILSSVIGEPDYRFDPHEYTQIEPDDNYWKATNLWASDDFVMPAKRQRPEIALAVEMQRRALGNRRLTRANTLARLPEDHPDRAHVMQWYPDDRIHLMSPGADRGDKRSESPRGFCRALYEANAPHLRRAQLELVA